MHVVSPTDMVTELRAALLACLGKAALFFKWSAPCVTHLRIGGSRHGCLPMKGRDAILGIVFFAVAFSLEPSSATRPIKDDVAEAGRLLTLLLDAGRVTIANKQPLINDPK